MREAPPVEKVLVSAIPVTTAALAGKKGLRVPSEPSATQKAMKMRLERLSVFDRPT